MEDERREKEGGRENKDKEMGYWTVQKSGRRKRRRMKERKEKQKRERKRYVGRMGNEREGEEDKRKRVEGKTKISERIKKRIERVKKRKGKKGKRRRRGGVVEMKNREQREVRG